MIKKNALSVSKKFNKQKIYKMILTNNKIFKNEFILNKLKLDSTCLQNQKNT